MYKMSKNNFSMEISEIKQRLTMANVIHYYGLKTDKQSRLNCPFHEDKTPSFQVYYKTQTAYCFSSNCKTHGKSMDVIDFVMHKENCTKHEALKKCKEILGYQKPDSKEHYQPDLSKSQFLTNMFQYFKNAVHNSKPAKKYLESRSLDFKRLEVGYNAGQFHHGERRDETLIEQCLEYGLLIDKGITSRTGNPAYGVFGKWCISFALKDKENNVTGLYFRSTLTPQGNKSPAVANRHFYLKDRKGLYPNHPSKNCKKLILTEAIIDAASLLQIETIIKEYEVLSCYGTNGLTEEHQQAIKELRQLEEIIFFFDNDTAGKEAVKKYGAMLKAEYPKLKLSQAEPINKDINETLQGHEESIFIELLNNRKDIFLSPENKTTEPPKIVNASTSIDFLQRKHLLENLNQLIGKAGIVGEENSRMLLFLIIISYVNKSPLHALVQGSSGSGKTHIISRIADMMLHGVSPYKTHLAYRFALIDYSVTADSQEEKNSHWHSMMSNEEAERGMTRQQSLKRGLKFGWDNIFSQKDGENLGKLGQGIHALQDAIAHEGVKTSDHLFGNSFSENFSSLKKFTNDMYGSTYKASLITNSAIIISGLVQGKNVGLKSGETLLLNGMSSNQLHLVIQLLRKQGFEGTIKNE